MIGWKPEVSVLIGNVADPLAFSPTMATAVAPSLMVTVPVGVAPRP